jgi:transcription elongation factor Elf1
MSQISNCPFCNSTLILSDNDSFYSLSCNNSICKLTDKLDSSRFNCHYTLPFKIDYYSFWIEENSIFYKISSSRISEFYQFTSVFKSESAMDDLIGPPIFSYHQFIPLPTPISDIKQVFTRLTQLAPFL